MNDTDAHMMRSGVVMALILAAAILLFFTGCAPRFLTEKQDTALRSLCKNGCVVVPERLMERIKESLKETCS